MSKFTSFIRKEWKKKAIVLSVLSIVLALAAFFFFNKKFRSLKYDFETGKRYSYKLAYKSENKTHIPQLEGGKTLSGSMNCTFLVDFIPFKKENGYFFLHLVTRDIQECNVFFNGNNIINSSGQSEFEFKNRVAVLKIHESGKIKKVFFRKQERDIFKNTIMLLAGELQMIFGENGSWKKREVNQYGRYDSLYERKGMGFSSARVLKKKEKYSTLSAVNGSLSHFSQDVDSSMKMDFSLDGYPEKIEGFEKSVVRDTTGVEFFNLNTSFLFEMVSFSKFQNDYNFELPDYKKMSDATPGKIDVSEKKERELLEKRAMGISAPDIAEAFDDLAQIGDMHDKSGFWWKASGFLKLHPERSEDFVKIFQKKKITYKPKMFVLGILVSAGHPQAQAAIRKILDLPSTKADPMYSLYFQNISHIKNPDRETVDYVKNFYMQTRSSGEMRTTASLTAGAVASRLYRNGDRSEAEKMRTHIVEDLKSARTDGEREYLLDGIGNMGMEENTDEVVQFVGSKNPRIRASVANALRRVQTGETEEILFDLVKDRASVVQRKSISVLYSYNLDSERITDLKKNVVDGTIRENSYLDVIHLMAKYPNETENMEEALLGMKERGVSDKSVLARINHVLTQLKSRTTTK